MIRIAITAAAFEAIARTLLLGSVGYESEPNEQGVSVSVRRHALARYWTLWR